MNLLERLRIDIMNDTRDALGNRMKEYEFAETQRKFMPGLPIYARIDGRSFSRFTKGMARPYDERMSNTMIDTTKELVSATHATVGYCQSDELSLAWIPADVNHSWFDGKITKMTSVLAGLATSAFSRALMENFGFEEGLRLLAKLPHFDARVICLPNETECANMFLWRNMDCTKNSISMAAHHYYSHRELQGKTGSEKQEMLFQKGINFNDYPSFFKRGTWVRRAVVERELTESERAAIPEQHRPKHGEKVMRTVINAFDLPPLNKISNRVDVLFNDADPIGN